MEFFVDRRNDRHDRMNTDSSVELVHEDFEEPFEADCVDLSPGGAAVRASCLPEVGASFICRFEGQGEGENVEVLGTVVWVHLEGERKGEFGLRFLNIDERTEELIAAILRQSGVEHVEQDEISDEAAKGSPDAAVSHLFLDGISTPIAARITQTRGDMTTFEQELPLLRIERGVSARQPGGQPRRGTIAAVQLRVVDDTPKLVITVRHQYGMPDDGPGAEQLEQREAAPPPEPETQQQEEGTSNWGPVIAALEGAALPASAKVDPGPAAVNPARAQGAFEPDEACRDLFEIADDDDEAQWPPERMSSLRAFARANLALWLAALVSLKAVVLAASRSLAARLRGQTLPAVARGAASARVQTESLVRKRIVPLLVSGVRRIRLPRLFQRRRRTTAFFVPGEQPGRNRGRAMRETTAAFGKALLLPALAMSGGLLAAYGFGTWWSSNDIIPLHALYRSQTAPAQEAVAGAARRPGPAVAEQEALSVEMVEPAPRKEAAGSPSAAEQPAPAASPAVAATAPAAASKAKRPSELERVSRGADGLVFGSRKLVGGSSYVLRMSKKIEELRGLPDQGGFTVIIPGSLSFDPAGPIAASHPLVGRSLILNKGDHAALTVRFVKGASPAYRVAAVGSSLHITISDSSS